MGQKITLDFQRSQQGTVTLDVEELLNLLDLNAHDAALLKNFGILPDSVTYPAYGSPLHNLLNKHHASAQSKTYIVQYVEVED